jgi:hypothetical protein
LNDQHFDIPYYSKEVKKKLLETPIHHEIVMAWSINNINNIHNHPVYDALMKKMRPIYDYGDGLNFLTKIYADALEYIPLILRDSVKEKIQQYVVMGNEKDRNKIISWNTSHIINEPMYKDGQNILNKILS